MKNGKMKRTQVLATFFSVLLVSPLCMTAMNVNQVLDIPTIKTQTRTRSIPILDEAKTFDETVVITSWPNGSELLELEWNCSRLAPDCRNFSYKASAMITTHKPEGNNMIAYGLPPMPNPTYPPDVPPPPVDHKFMEGMWYLPDGVKYPPGEDPFYILHDQPDNWFSYHKRDWWTDWAYMTYYNTFPWHIGSVNLGAIIRGEKSDSELAMWAWAGASLAMGLGAAAAGYFAATAAEGTLLAVECPPIAFVLGCAAAFAGFMAIWYSEQRTSREQWYKDNVLTTKDDGFARLEVCTGTDKTYVYDLWLTKPGCEVMQQITRKWTMFLGNLFNNPIDQRAECEYQAYVLIAGGCRVTYPAIDFLVGGH